MKLKMVVVGAVKEFQYKMEPEDSKWKISQMCPLEEKKKKKRLRYISCKCLLYRQLTILAFS